MQKRLKIIMDDERKILPDGKNNYLVGVWDGTFENAICISRILDCSALIIWPEGLGLTYKEYENRVKEESDERTE